MPSDHRLSTKQAIHPRELVGEIFIGGANATRVLRAVTEDYLRHSGGHHDRPRRGNPAADVKQMGRSLHIFPLAPKHLLRF
jgi:hypothetical protein